jgi:large subunit ribosomal protein L23
MQVLKRPLLTEELAKMQEKGVYAFEVDRKANKYQIKEAVQKAYSVQVAAVNTMILPGKRKTRYAKGNITAGRTASYKKALVTLEKGEYIDVYENL